MQIVLSGNRIIAHGENFLAMGGTVVCNETGKTYANATIAECDKIPCDIDTVGYEYHAGKFVPCAPYGPDNGEGYIMLACRECATPKNSGRSLDDILGARLTVAAEFGSQIACYKDDRVVYPKEKMEGLWWIDLPEYGEWTVKATLGDVSGEKKINVTVLKEYYAYFGYGVKVTYPAGAVCTLTKGETVLTAPDVSGSTTFIVYDPGEWTVTATDGEETASFVVTVAGTENEMKTVKLNFAPEVRTTPESGVTYNEGITNISWEDLSRYGKAIAASGIDSTAATVYLNDANVFFEINVGDTKTFTLNGSTYTARIIGFNHDELTAGDNYGSTKAGFTLETVELYPTATKWSESGADAWNNSTLRSAIANAYANIEDALENVIVSVKKKYDDDPTVKDNTTFAYADDKFFALSAEELFGENIYANIAEGKQYAFYAAGNSAVKNGADGVAKNYWTRSTNATGTAGDHRISVNVVTGTASPVQSQFNAELYFFGAFCI